MPFCLIFRNKSAGLDLLYFSFLGLDGVRSKVDTEDCVELEPEDNFWFSNLVLTFSRAGVEYFEGLKKYSEKRVFSHSQHLKENLIVSAFISGRFNIFYIISQRVDCLADNSS